MHRKLTFDWNVYKFSLHLHNCNFRWRVFDLCLITSGTRGISETSKSLLHLNQKGQKQCNYFSFCCKHILSVLKYKQFLTRKWFQQNLKILSEYFMNLKTELLSKVRFSRVSWFFTEQFLLPSWSGLNDCFLKSGAILPGPPLYVAHIVLLYMYVGQHTFGRSKGQNHGLTSFGQILV